MILKEAYRYMNYLDSLLESAKIYLENPQFITTTKQTHCRTKVNPNAQDEVIQRPKPFDTTFTPMQLVDFVVKVLEEKEHLSASIAVAKKTTAIDMDHAIAMNKKRQEFVAILNSMNYKKGTERTVQGSAYKFNQEGNQVNYFYDIEEVVTIDFDRNDIKGLIKKYTKVCDEISAQLDMLLITTEVKYEPLWDINDTLDDLI